MQDFEIVNMTEIYASHDDKGFGFLYNSNDMPYGKRGVDKKEENGEFYVRCIRVGTNNKQYINEIKEYSINYCKPPRSDLQACENSKNEKKPFDVFIMSGTKNYYWGEGIITTNEDVNEKGQSRYIIERVSRNKKLVKGIKRNRDEEAVISEGCVFEGEYFPSKLEALYAKFFKLVEMDAKHEKISIYIDNNTTYIPDFYIRHPFKAYVEIKPDEPPIDAILKCEETCKLTGIDVYLFFKKKFGPPYEKSGRSYTSSNNIRAYKWYMKHDRVVRDESKYSFVANESGTIYIDKVEDLNIDKRFFDEKLKNIYDTFDDKGIETLR